MAGTKRGRKTVWKPEVEALLGEALELGLSRNRAADFAGVSRSIFYARVKDDEAFSEWVNAREAAGMVHHARKLRDIEEVEPGHAAAVIAAAKLHLTTRGEDAWTEKKALEHSGGVTVADTAKAMAGIDAAMAAGDGEEDA